jgi:hypothetical protein
VRSSESQNPLTVIVAEGFESEKKTGANRKQTDNKDRTGQDRTGQTSE